MGYVLIAVGIALIVFGGVVLLRYSDRPGATVKWLGTMEMSSAGAGLPLIGLGVVCLVLAIVPNPIRGSSDTSKDAADETAVEEVEPSADTSVRPGVARTVVDACFAPVIGSLPEDRVGRVEVGMREMDVIRPDQSRDEPFGVILTENGEGIGAIRFRRYAGSNSSEDLYKVEAIVDSSCQPVSRLRNVSRGGDPRALVNWDVLGMRLGDHEYQLRIGGETGIGVGPFTRMP